MYNCTYLNNPFNNHMYDVHTWIIPFINIFKYLMTSSYFQHTQLNPLSNKNELMSKRRWKYNSLSRPSNCNYFYICRDIDLLIVWSNVCWKSVQKFRTFISIPHVSKLRKKIQYFGHNCWLWLKRYRVDLNVVFRIELINCLGLQLDFWLDKNLNQRGLKRTYKLSQ